MNEPQNQEPQPQAGTPTPPPLTVALPPEAAGLKVEIIRAGTGAVAAAGDMVTVHYIGVLPDGTKFDSSLDRGTPFSFQLGAGRVIRGWDYGLVGMKVGEERRLTIPPNLGYGEAGTPGGPIPPNATLIFAVELLAVEKPR